MARVEKFLLVMLVSVSPALVWAAGAHSGFLEDYSKLTADPKRPGAESFHAEGVDLGDYSNILIDPVEIWYAPDSKYKGISPDELKAVADAFRGILVDALEPAYPVVSKPGPSVLRVRLAIANVKMKRKKRGLLSFTPAGFALTTMRNLAGKRIVLGDATVEAELMDGSSDATVGLLVDKLSKTTDDMHSWETLEQTLQYYAKRFRTRLDAEHE